MREEARDPGRLEHIIHAINNIEEFIKGFDFDSLSVDKRTLYAITYNIQIIGEATYMLTKEFKNDHPEIDWAIIEKMRHILVHGYYKLNARIIWNVATEDIPQLKPAIIKLQESLSIQ